MVFVVTQDDDCSKNRDPNDPVIKPTTENTITFGNEQPGREVVEPITSGNG